MIRFKAKIDIEFNAKDIDDAFRRLEDHFYNLRTYKADKSLLDESDMLGELEVFPKDD